MPAVTIEQGGPLFWTEPQSCFHCYADDLGIMFPTKGLIGAELREAGREEEGGGREGIGEEEGRREERREPSDYEFVIY